MGRFAAAVRWLLVCAMLLAGLSGCQSVSPAAGVEVTDASSILAVEVRFPVSLGRDPSLVKAYLVHGPIHAGLDALPELVLASFVKGARAYLLDPEPGTYSLVGVTYAYAPPRNHGLVAGVRDTVAAGGDIGNAVVLPAEWIERTRTTVAPGRVAFMGTLRIREGERVNADTRFADVLQERLAEAVRPGSTSLSGLAGRFSLTWTLDRDASAFQRDAAAEQAFLHTAYADLGDSPWAEMFPGFEARVSETIELARETRWPTREPAPLKPRPPAPQPSAPPPPPPPAPEVQTQSVPARAPEVQPEPALPEPPAPEPESVAEAPRPEPVVAVAEPEAPPSPERPAETRRPAPTGKREILLSEIPRGTGSLDQVERGMSHEVVRRLLGDPDERSSYMTLKALIPFYSGPDTHQRTWTYHGRGQVVFSLNSRTGSLRVIRVLRAEPEPQ